jgi:hypothetical protein
VPYSLSLPLDLVPNAARFFLAFFEPCALLIVLTLLQVAQEAVQIELEIVVDVHGLGVLFAVVMDRGRRKPSKVHATHDARARALRREISARCFFLEIGKSARGFFVGEDESSARDGFAIVRAQHLSRASVVGVTAS